MGSADAGVAATRADELITALRTLERQLAAALTEVDLTPDTWRALRRIVASDGCSMKELAEWLVLAPASATRTVDSLVSRSLVYRRASEADRRSILVHASTLGADTLARADELIAAEAASLIS